MTTQSYPRAQRKLATDTQSYRAKPTQRSLNTGLRSLAPTSFGRQAQSVNADRVDAPALRSRPLADETESADKSRTITRDSSTGSVSPAYTASRCAVDPSRRCASVSLGLIESPCLSCSPCRVLRVVGRERAIRSSGET